MKKLFPRPGMSVVLLCIWLMLNQSLDPTYLLTGALIAWWIPLWVQLLLPQKLRIHNPWMLVRLLSWALIEIIRSNIGVSRIILFRRSKGIHSEFIHIPLDMRNPHGHALLSCLINCTPGTVWVELTPDNRQLLLHVFDLHDEAWWVDTIKTRYEQPLMAIFEGATSC